MNAALRASLLVLVILTASCRKEDTLTPGGDSAKTATSTQPATAPAAAQWPAFHDGGPLLGVAETIGPPPMRVRWKYKEQSDQTGAPPAFEGSAAIVNGAAIIGDRSGALISVSLKTGQRNWLYKSEAGFSASPAVVDGIVFIGDEDGVFHAVRADTGKKLWTFDAQAPIHSSANFVGSKIIFGTDGADIFCLN
ncbi:MAG TPA: PQQ-binding-like beta-propeller repeat protein, partial [Tepidisphaeraceae bacterium]|nr:PQQ-binding-like beta-propeller repeat protein [Tepidisphaeraceae bacterium]